MEQLGLAGSRCVEHVCWEGCIEAAADITSFRATDPRVAAVPSASPGKGLEWHQQDPRASIVSSLKMGGLKEKRGSSSESYI